MRETKVNQVIVAIAYNRLILCNIMLFFSQRTQGKQVESNHYKDRLVLVWRDERVACTHVGNMG